MENIIGLDKTITLLFYNLFPHNLFFDRFFSFFSYLGDAGAIWIIIFIILILLEQNRHHRFVKIFFIAFIFTFLVNEYLLKFLFERIRPINDLAVFSKFMYTTPLEHVPRDFSFPSGHTATSFAAATVLSYFDKKRTLIFFMIATFIAVSRLYLGVHFVFDIIVGATLGFTIAKIIIYCYETKRPRTTKS